MYLPEDMISVVHIIRSLNNCRIGSGGRGGGEFLLIGDPIHVEPYEAIISITHWSSVDYGDRVLRWVEIWSRVQERLELLGSTLPKERLGRVRVDCADKRTSVKLSYTRAGSPSHVRVIL